MALPRDILELRRQHAVPIGQIYTRTYRLPVGTADSLIPARGDVVALDGVTPTTGLLAPRVLHNPRRQETSQTGLIEVVIDFIQVEPYTAGQTAAPLEIKSSRREWDDTDRVFGERIFVATTEAALPDTGVFFVNSAGIDETTLVLRGRKCNSRNIDDQSVPGLYLATLAYVAHKPYTAGDDTSPMEVKGSRREWDDAEHNFGERIFVAATEAALPDAGVFFVNSAGTNESALALRGRKCVNRKIDDQSIPGIYIATLTYLGFKPFGTGGSATDRIEIRPRSGPDLAGFNNWNGRRTWLTTYAAARAISATVWGENFPDMSGYGTPQAMDTHIEYDPEGWIDSARVLVNYRKLIVRIRPPTIGKMQLTMSGLYTYELPDGLVLDENVPPKIVQGIAGVADSDTGVSGLVYVWRPKIKSGPYPIIKVATAAYRVDVDATLAYIGTTNSQGCPKIFGADADELLMLKIEMGHEYGGDVVGLNFYAAYNFDKWANVVKSQKGCWIVMKRPVFEWDTTMKTPVEDDEEPPKKTLEFVPQTFVVVDGKRKGIDSPIESRKMFNSTAWSHLAGLLIWET